MFYLWNVIGKLCWVEYGLSSSVELSWGVREISSKLTGLLPKNIQLKFSSKSPLLTLHSRFISIFFAITFVALSNTQRGEIEKLRIWQKYQQYQKYQNVGYAVARESDLLESLNYSRWKSDLNTYIGLQIGKSLCWQCKQAKQKASTCLSGDTTIFSSS